MSRLKKLLQYVLIIFLLNINESIGAMIDYSGKWCFDGVKEIDSFTVIISKISNAYRGSYLTVAYRGMKIDDVEDAFNFKETEKKIVKLELKSGTSKKVGSVRIKYINNNTISWQILTIPGGEFYAPEKATLHRCG
ncbi:hypothetical protein EP47_11680 [Legionella norrlandica]|uniref:Uncharacterized protein n=1 Tax=Legionella norrlandica TaxID=1498499 RepID=A0A0A2STK3_9GAMM|nr:hypothetical protein [Legionella norrlandica]KGP64420.1 hypothetical protein EP47_11680 [Legionella norrlandica]